MALNSDQYRLSDAEHQAIFERDLKPVLFAGVRPSHQPVAVIFGGQPGAGKSAAVEGAMNELGSHGGAVQIIGDDLRGYHPKYAQLMERDDKTAAFYTDRDTGRWVEKAIAEAKALRVHIVIEGTMRDGDKVAATMDGMLRTLDRIEADKLANRVTIYRRGAEAIYSNELQDRQWIREPRARAVVEAERARPMTPQERRDYAKGFDELADMLARPERQASAEELGKIADLQRQARSNSPTS
jgi:hypothetical protein